MTTTPTIIVARLRSGDRIAVGLASGDRDECGTEYESETLHEVVVFDRFGDAADVFPAYDIQVTQFLDPTDRLALAYAADYARRKFASAESRLDHLREQLEAAELEARRWAPILEAANAAVQADWEASR